MLQLIVRRPRGDEREVLAEGELSPEDGLAGDNWKTRGSMGVPVSPGQMERQITIMNSRLIDLLAGDRAVLAAGRGPALHGPRPERGQPASRHAARGGLCHPRGHRSAALRLQ